MKLLPGLMLTALVVSACGAKDTAPDPAPDPVLTAEAATPSTGTTPMTPVLPTSFNPCHRLRVAPVVAQLGSDLIKNLGHTGERRCALLPTTTGDPVITVTYQPYDLGLDAVLVGLGEDPSSAVRPHVPHADDARLLIALDPTQLFTTGFIKVGGLVEVVNGADPPPYDAVALVHATEEVMRQLAATAPAMR